MSWTAAILVGVFCGVAGAILTMMAGDSITRIFRVSTFEGAAGYLIVFLLVPLGFIVGLATGIVIMRVNAPHGIGPILLYQGLGILVTSGLLTAGYGLAYLSRDRPPRIDGQSMSLDLELRYRPIEAEDPRDELIRASLYATNKDNNYVDIDTSRAEVRDGWIVVSSNAGLYSRSSSRMFSVTREAGGHQVFELPLSPKPSRADTTWCDWFPPREPLGESERPVVPERLCQLRYRLHVGD